jgi:beta-galactosidase
MAVGDSVLQYATAQPICKLPTANTYVFAAWPGIRVEFALKEKPGDTIEAPDAQLDRSHGIVYVEITNPGSHSVIRLRQKNGEFSTIVVLTREQAENLWKLNLAGKERLVLTPAQLYTDGDRLTLLSSNVSDLKADLFPALEGTVTGFKDAGEDGVFRMYTAQVAGLNLTAKVQELNGPQADPPFKMGKEIVLAPDNSAFQSAAKWSIQTPNVKSDTISDIWLKITYEGDIARIYAGGKLLTDNFYNGQPWLVGLHRFPRTLLGQPLELRILPLQAQAPIYLASGARPTIPPGAQSAKLKNVELIATYRVTLDLRH